MLAGCMTMGAVQFQAPEWEVGEPEAKEYLTHVQNVMRHYSVESTQKSIDTAMLVFASAMFLGTRSVATMARMREEKEGKRKPADRGSVVHGPWPAAMNQQDMSFGQIIPGEPGEV
jgi:hypothetical protein